MKKSVFKESFHAAGKILSNKRNYSLVKIIQDDKQSKDLKVGEQCKIEKKSVENYYQFNYCNCLEKKNYDKISLILGGGQGGVDFQKFF